MGVWISENLIEIFGAATGILYVILEIRRNIFLWPLGIITSVVYIWVFAGNALYASMGLQVYYLFISIYGWYKWRGAANRGHGEKGMAHVDDLPAGVEVIPRSGRGESSGQERKTDVRRIEGRTAVICLVAVLSLWGFLWFVLDRWTDSPVPLWDGLISSLSVVATWMLTRKFLEQWYLWIVADGIAVIVYALLGLYATAALFLVYTVMAVTGVRAWSRERGTGEQTNR